MNNANLIISLYLFVVGFGLIRTTFIALRNQLVISKEPTYGDTDKITHIVYLVLGIAMVIPLIIDGIQNFVINHKDFSFIVSTVEAALKESFIDHLPGGEAFIYFNNKFLVFLQTLPGWQQWIIGPILTVITVFFIRMVFTIAWVLLTLLLGLFGITPLHMYYMGIAINGLILILLMIASIIYGIFLLWHLNYRGIYILFFPFIASYLANVSSKNQQIIKKAFTF